MSPLPRPILSRTGSVYLNHDGRTDDERDAVVGGDVCALDDVRDQPDLAFPFGRLAARSTHWITRTRSCLAHSSSFIDKHKIADGARSIDDSDVAVFSRGSRGVPDGAANRRHRDSAPDEIRFLPSHLSVGYALRRAAKKPMTSPSSICQQDLGHFAVLRKQNSMKSFQVELEQMLNVGFARAERGEHAELPHMERELLRRADR